MFKSLVSLTNHCRRYYFSNRSSWRDHCNWICRLQLTDCSSSTEVPVPQETGNDFWSTFCHTFVLSSSCLLRTHRVCMCERVQMAMMWSPLTRGKQQSDTAIIHSRVVCAAIELILSLANSIQDLFVLINFSTRRWR